MKDGVLPLDVYLPVFSHSGTKLNKYLCLALSATPGYVPPPATFDSEAPEGVPSINAGGPVRKKNGKENL